jgi:hypothetical protein
MSAFTGHETAATILPIAPIIVSRSMRSASRRPCA